MLAEHQIISPSQGNTESRNVSPPFWEGREGLGPHLYPGVAPWSPGFFTGPAVQAPQEEKGWD